MLTVTKNGKPLDQTLYMYDKVNKVSSSSEKGLVIHYEGSGCTFKTGYGCVIVRRDIFEVIRTSR